MLRLPISHRVAIPQCYLVIIHGDYSEYNLYGIDSLAFNACNTGSSIPYHVQLRHVKFKAGYFYTMYLKGNMGSTIDSLGFAVIENNGNVLN